MDENMAIEDKKAAVTQALVKKEEYSSEQSVGVTARETAGYASDEVLGFAHIQEELIYRAMPGFLALAFSASVSAWIVYPLFFIVGVFVFAAMHLKQDAGKAGKWQSFWCRCWTGLIYSAVFMFVAYTLNAYVGGGLNALMDANTARMLSLATVTALGTFLSTFLHRKNNEIYNDYLASREQGLSIDENRAAIRAKYGFWAILFKRPFLG